jgi:tRNA threonylcarbamoyladenosine biosynthesis protein TsaB
MKGPKLTAPVLAIDASDSASLVLALPDRPWQGVSIDEGKGRASELLDAMNLVLRSEGLAAKDLGALVLCSGPGSFTGLRIAAGFVQGLARGLQRTVAVVSAFEAYALAWLFGSVGSGQEERGASSAVNRSYVEVFLNARLGEFYKAGLRFNPGFFQFEILEQPLIVQHETIGLNTDLAPSSKVMTGSQIQLIEPRIQDYRLPFGCDLIKGQPESLQTLAYWSLAAATLSVDPQRFGPAVQAQPLYVREKVALTREERQKGPAMGLQSLRLADLASVMVIEIQSYEVPWTSGNFRDAFSSGYALLKLVDQGVMIGYLVYMRVLDECHLLNFTIAPRRQRRGAGQFMLEQLLKKLVAEQVNVVMLEVRPSNQSAIRLYERNGFQRVGLRKDYYPTARGESVREDAVLMNRSLTSMGVS